MNLTTLIPYAVGCLTLLLLFLIFFVASNGKVAKLYEGADGRPSTSKFQFFAWTVVIVFAYVAMYALKISQHHFEPIDYLPQNILVAMGMSVISAAAAKSITVSYVDTGKVTKNPPDPQHKEMFGDVFKDDSGVPDLAKVQMIAWTFIAIATYLISLGNKIYHKTYSQLPDIDTSLMVLMGLGHGAYLGKKLVTTDTSEQPSGKQPSAPLQPANAEQTF